jgi:hypothetical protein
MAPSSWIILSTTPRVSDTPLPHDFALSLKVEAPPRVSFLTVAPWVSGDRDPLIKAFDPSGLLLVYTWPTYCVLDVPAATLSYRLPEDPPTCFDEYRKLGVIADPGGAAGAFVLADFHFTAGSEGEDNTLVRYWSRTRSWRTELEASPDEHEDEVPDRYWVFDDVISHGGNIWWIDTKAGLLTCNAFRDRPPFLYVPLPDDDDDDDEEDRLPSDFKTKFEAGMVGRRYVQLSDGKFRCVHIRKPKGHAHGAGAAPTFITMRTLNDPKTGDWTDPEYTLSFADIRASDTFKAAGLPDKDPVFALIHPKNSDVLYFFLDDYLFAFDMRAKKLIECEAHGLGNNPSSGSVRAWELPPDYAAAIAPASAPAGINLLALF